MSSNRQGPGKFQRFVGWCRANPRAASALAAVLVVLWVIGAVTQDDKSDNPSATAKQQAVETAPATFAPTTPLPSPSVSPSTAGQTAAVADVQQRSSTDASSLLLGIVVKGRAPQTGYDRSKFGTAWTDDNRDPLGHNGCDTRNDILKRDLTNDVLKAGTNGCVLASGVLADPYTAKRISFTRGTTSTAVQIDHVVALSNAWQTGAQQWTDQTRTDFANDPLNLLAVDGPTNEAKGDGDTATWLPPNKAYRCAYVARQVAVKARYKLWMTEAEQQAAYSLLYDCGHQLAPAEAQPATINLIPEPVRTTPRPVKRSTVAPAPETTTEDEPAPAGCTTTSSGNCIRGGQFCPSASEGEEGTDAQGRTYICRGDDGHPHWEKS